MRRAPAWTRSALLLAVACTPVLGPEEAAPVADTATSEDSAPPPAPDSAAPAPADTAPTVPLLPPDGDTGCGPDVDLLTDPRNCGACGITCVVPHAEGACVDGVCGAGTCDVGFADCDGDALTGCEHPIDCPSGTACPTTCGTEGAISCADPCTPVCAPPAEACNAMDDDCDGQCDQGAIPGCRVAIHRAYGTKGHVFTPSLSEANAWGTLEAANFFYLYTDAAADLRPFFRCNKAGGRVFYTESNDCEMTGAPAATIGFIAPAPTGARPGTCGSVPLYRLRNEAAGLHFYTISAPERDAAVGNGWLDEGVAGYVWRAP